MYAQTLQSHTQLNEFRGGVSRCQSQEELCMLLQIRDNAGASVQIVCVLWWKNSKCLCPPCCVEAYLHRVDKENEFEMESGR